MRSTTESKLAKCRSMQCVAKVMDRAHFAPCVLQVIAADVAAIRRAIERSIEGCDAQPIAYAPSAPGVPK